MEKKSKILIYSIIGILILFVVIIIVMLLGGYIKDATTKRTCRLTDKIYVEGSKPGMAICTDK